MGGRTERPQGFYDRDMWITQVSEDRLLRYEAMLESGGQFRRQDGSPRLERERVYLQGLIEMERKRRGDA